jgi:hypothetical protein
MPFCSVENISYYKFQIFENLGVYQAIFTRNGGVSPKPWESLNFGASVGDDHSRVTKNRTMALESIGLHPDTVYDVYQIHSSNVVITEKPLDKTEIHLRADAILTDRPNVTLLMRFADCVPILLYDPKRHAVAIVHAGWVGTVEKIVQKVIVVMKQNYGTNPGDILAGIGPSIGPDHYSIGLDVISRVRTSFGMTADHFIETRNGVSYFNLWDANNHLLGNAGVTKIEVSQICTNCHTEDWYSHRG